VRDLAILFLHLLATVARLAGPGGARSVVAESVLVKQQLLILNRSRCLDLFRCESAVLRSHWVLVVMDQCTRRIVGFGVHRGLVDGLGLCRMFNHATRGQTPPTYLSADHDPLYRFHQWQANLRILDVREIKTMPYVPLSHPFVERLIGTIRRECLDRTLFWTAADLETKLVDFQRYYNRHRTHAGLDRRTPEPSPDAGCPGASVRAYRWQSHCRGLYQTPIAA
jgi:putative transposase